MRLTATSIAIFSLLVSGCAVQPQDQKKELAALNGPKLGTVDDALKGQAEQALAAKDYVHATQMYRQMVDKDPTNRDYVNALADSLRRSGDYQGTVNLLDPYIVQHADDATALETRGLALMSLGNFPDAGKSFEQVMKVEPTRWRTLNAIGILFTMKNKLQDAVTYYDEALEHSEDNASVLNNRGLTLAMDNKFDDAIESFMRTRKHLRVGSPDLKQVDMNLALVYAIAGRMSDAETTAAPYLSKVALYNNMGVYAKLGKNPELSRSYLNMALTQSSTYYERAWKNLGAIEGEVNAPEASGVTTTVTEKKSKAKKKQAAADIGIRMDQIPSPPSDAR